MLIQISTEFWIDFDDVRLIIPVEEGELKVFYRSNPDFTIIPDDLKDEFLLKIIKHQKQDLGHV